MLFALLHLSLAEPNTANSIVHRTTDCLDYFAVPRQMHTTVLISRWCICMVLYIRNLKRTDYVNTLHVHCSTRKVHNCVVCTVYGCMHTARYREIRQPMNNEYIVQCIIWFCVIQVYNGKTLYFCSIFYSTGVLDSNVKFISAYQINAFFKKKKICNSRRMCLKFIFVSSDVTSNM